MRWSFVFVFLLIHFVATAQITVQTVRGTVMDRASRQPIAGATVTIVETANLSTIADSMGKYVLTSVPVGRVKLKASFVGYQDYQTDNLLLSSAKELQVDLEMEEGKGLQQAVIIATARNSKQPVNRNVLVSGRSFSAEETQRFAASANDPSRMVMGFPGVQATRDTRSDIVIRGNNPVGMQWRLEGVDIMNPNHFARRGSTGGGITIFSLSMLDNSDFLTGAMPAEYGDVLSGVFDVHFRKGNEQKREHTLKAGMIGLDYSTEGPIQKGQSSYLANYRYSTLGLLQTIGLNLVGERETNTFQDLSFNTSFRNKSNTVQWNLWGMGGYSKETFVAVEDTARWKQYDDYAVYDFRTRMGATGIGNTVRLSAKSFIRSSLVAMGQRVTFVDDTLTKQRIASTVNDEDYRNNRFSFTSSLHHKFSALANMKAGFYVSNMIYQLQRKRLNYASKNLETTINGKGNTWLWQPYLQASLQPGLRWTINPGLHLMHLALNNKTTVDPRLSVQYRLRPGQNISFAYGLHSKTLPLGYYFYRHPVTNSFPNLDLDMMRAHHYILAYDYLMGKGWRLHTEGYYQSLFQVPVASDVNRTFWMLNELDGYAREPLVSKGKGINKGIDISVEKFFSKGFFMIAAFSVFQSTFQPLNGKEYNTRFNSGSNGSWTGTREWSLKNNKVLQFGWKMIYNGGFRQTPLANVIATSREPVLDETRPFTDQVSPYFRTDTRIAIRKDKAGRAWQLALDIQNIFGIQNQDGLFRRFDPSVNRWISDTQSGIVPVLSYQVDF